MACAKARKTIEKIIQQVIDSHIPEPEKPFLVDQLKQQLEVPCDHEVDDEDLELDDDDESPHDGSA